MYWHEYKDQVAFHLRVNLRVLSIESGVMKKIQQVFPVVYAAIGDDHDYI